MSDPDPIDHSQPLTPGSAVARSRLARVLGVPTLSTPDGRLYRVVAVWRGSLASLLDALGRAGVAVAGPVDIGPKGGPPVPCHHAEGVVFHEIRGVVLCGAREDVVETLEESGRLGLLLAASAGRSLPHHDGESPRALPATGPGTLARGLPAPGDGR